MRRKDLKVGRRYYWQRGYRDERVALLLDTQPWTETSAFALGSENRIITFEGDAGDHRDILVAGWMRRSADNRDGVLVEVMSPNERVGAYLAVVPLNQLTEEVTEEAEDKRAEARRLREARAEKMRAERARREEARKVRSQRLDAHGIKAVSPHPGDYGVVTLTEEDADTLLDLASLRVESPEHTQ